MVYKTPKPKANTLRLPWNSLSDSHPEKTVPTMPHKALIEIT